MPLPSFLLTCVDGSAEDGEIGTPGAEYDGVSIGGDIHSG